MAFDSRTFIKALRIGGVGAAAALVVYAVADRLAKDAVDAVSERVKTVILGPPNLTINFSRPLNLTDDIFQFERISADEEKGGLRIIRKGSSGNYIMLEGEFGYYSMALLYRGKMINKPLDFRERDQKFEINTSDGEWITSEAYLSQRADAKTTEQNPLLERF